MDAGWISLTFDDALDQHRETVIPLLNRHQLVGTFYTHLSAPGFVHHVEKWKAAAIAGHELGNHTVFHPAVSSKAWVRPGNAIDDYSLDRMRMELEFANDWLSTIDGRTERTFAYPCSNPFVGHEGWILKSLHRLQLDRTRLSQWVRRCRLNFGATQKSYAGIVGELFIAGRGGGLNRHDLVPPVSEWSRTSLLSVAIENWTLAELQQHVTTTINLGRWAILQFHGVGGGHRMDCPSEVFTDFVGWLKAHHAHRIITVVEGARRLWPAPTAAKALVSSAGAMA